MTKLCILLVAAIFALTTAGCGKKGDDRKAAPAETVDQPEAARPEQATPVASEEDETAKLVAEVGPEVEAFMKTFIADVDAAGDDCAKLGPAATEVLLANAEVMDRMASAHHAPAADKWRNAHSALIKEFGLRMQKVARCAGDDPELMKAMMVMPKD